jgi:hypothetical protein
MLASTSSGTADMAFALNGFATITKYSGVSGSGTLTHACGGTLLSGTALLLAAISYTAPSTTPTPITSITDSQGNTWQKYDSHALASGWHTTSTNSGTQRYAAVEIWYTKNATVNTSIDLTITHSGTIDAADCVLSGKITGYNSTQPFDQNASLPKHFTNQSGVASQSVSGISTDTTNVYPFWGLLAFSSNISTSNPLFNGVSRADNQQGQKNNVEFVEGQLAYGPGATGPYSGVTYSSPTTSDNTLIICGALTADSQTPAAVPQPVITIMQ